MLLFEERDRVAGDTLAAAGETQTVGCGGFDADLPKCEAQMLCQMGAHGCDMGS